jgi:hypothetical protein
MKGRVMRGSRSTWGIAAALLAAGCFSVPPFQPENAVTYTETGAGGALVAGKGFELGFAGGDGFHFPDALRIDGADIMGRDPQTACFKESEIGVAIAPIARVSATGGAMPVASRLVPALRGPAVVQAKIEWENRFTCGLTTRNGGGTSTFTVFPDGRIVRHDAFDVPAGTPVAPVPCACEPPERSEDRLFNISTFWTVARERFTGFYLPGDDEAKPLPPPGDRIGNEPRSCLDAGAYQVAFAWPVVENITIRGAGPLVSFGRYLDIGLTELDAYRKENSSTLLIGRTGCEAALTRADELRTGTAVMIDGAARMPSPRDGIHGSNGGDGQPGIPLAGNQVDIVGPAPRGFAVWLRFPGSVDAVRARRGTAKVPGYLPQQVDDRSWIVYFPEPLADGETITIESI